jgi:pyruvate,water dikinase
MRVEARPWTLPSGKLQSGAATPAGVPVRSCSASSIVEIAQTWKLRSATAWTTSGGSIRFGGIVTDSGGMTCHAAIVSRELGIPCIVGTGSATRTLRDGELVTVDATHGVVLEGAAAAPERAVTAPRATAAAPVTATKLLVNLSEPSQIERAAALDVDGVGLLRAELMVLEALEGVHPRALLEQGRGEEFVSRMGDALTAFAIGFAPRPITYRTIDFRTNEFRGLEGGERFEPAEANPMIGYRGALRYTREPDVFRLELEAVRRV